MLKNISFCVNTVLVNLKKTLLVLFLDYSEKHVQSQIIIKNTYKIWRILLILHQKFTTRNKLYSSKVIHIAVAPGSFLRYFENMISKKSRFVGFQGLKNNFLVNELVYSTISGSLTTLRWFICKTEE